MSLHDKLKTIQSELKAPKDQTNTFGKYKYRSCEDILEAVKPLAHGEGCVVTLSDEIVEVGGRVYVKATAAITDGETKVSTDAFAREADAQSGMSSGQITGSSSSYARKYALNGLFSIDDTKDDDTRENTDQKKAPVKREDVNKASTGDVLRITTLCNETNTQPAQLYGHFGVVNVPTKEQAAAMIASLEKKRADQKKLSKELDAAALAQ